MSGYAARISQLIRDWEEATGDTASDYALSEDDYAYGIGAEDAAELAALLATQAGDSERAEVLARRVLADHAIQPHFRRSGEQIAALIAEGIRLALGEQIAVLTAEGIRLALGEATA